MVRGIVQGVGFRPFVFNAAKSAGLGGWVVNESDCVRIEVEGPNASVEQFVDTLRNHPPAQATIDEIEMELLEGAGSSATATGMFEIRPSSVGTHRGPAIPPDLATCQACRDEISTTQQRRYRYPFTNCTNCGPRWSIITGLPYDRPRTAMDTFEMCAACRQEYEDPTDRRFHAQPIACPDCGPTLQLVDAKGVEQAAGHGALEAAATAVRAGAVVAIKGLGGFQLIADATSHRTVSRLRQRKRRPDKPLAVMLADAHVVASYCHLSTFERAQLTSPQAPILLLQKRTDMPETMPLADAVAPGNPYLGVMLPNTPLHALLMAQVRRPVVCTSGNRSEEPMAIDTSDACERLAGIADLVLTHDRPIVRPVDDSVCRVEQDTLQILRRARGYAPVPIALKEPAPCVLAVGGHLKNAVALSIGKSVVIGSHVGDLDNTLSLNMHRQAINDLLAFYDVRPELIACDLHPDYSSTQHAERLARSWDVRLVRVQHHHAHLLSAIAEHQLTGPVLGFAWDGTGFGTDGTIWGGEAILVNGPVWKRVGHLRTFALPGGDRAAREPRRSALGVLHEFSGGECTGVANRWFQESELVSLLAALGRPGLFPRTSSMGRLFDAVAALCGLATTASYEGQAAMQLEFLAEASEVDRYDIHWVNGSIADWQPMIQQVLRDRAGGVSTARIAARFHNSLAHMALQIAQQVCCPQVILSGGCFQNRLLTRRIRTCLSEAGFEVYTQRLVPPGDGGLSLGQILGAVYQVGD